MPQMLLVTGPQSAGSLAKCRYWCSSVEVSPKAGGVIVDHLVFGNIPKTLL
jgi:hypothetical protein